MRRRIIGVPEQKTTCVLLGVSGSHDDEQGQGLAVDGHAQDLATGQRTMLQFVTEAQFLENEAAA